MQLFTRVSANPDSLSYPRSFLSFQPPCRALYSTTVSYLRVFGSLAWHQIPKERRRKLDAKSGSAIIVGCLENRQYKIWIPSKSIAFISRDVRIVEDKFPETEISDDLPPNEAIIVDDSETNRKGLLNNSQLLRAPVQSSNNKESSNSPSNNIQETEKTVAGQREDA